MENVSDFEIGQTVYFKGNKPMKIVKIDSETHCTVTFKDSTHNTIRQRVRIENLRSKRSKYVIEQEKRWLEEAGRIDDMIKRLYK